MTRARLVVVLAYGAALAAAIGAACSTDAQQPIAVVLEAGLAATVVVFAFSLMFRNSSLYDPYWSLAPLPIAIYWAQRPEIVGVNPIRLSLVLALVVFWSARLTWNWVRRWQGLGDEDWRCVELAEKTGALYWPASFLGIHILPTLWLLVAMLPVYVVMAAGREPFGYLDIVAFGVTLGGIVLEMRADNQLARYRASKPSPEEFLVSGVWAWSRHPNYLGEMGFWWGLWLFAIAANPGWWWTVLGPLAVTAMFRWVSLPWLETRMQQRRANYSDWIRRSSLVIPGLRPRTQTKVRTTS